MFPSRFILAENEKIFHYGDGENAKRSIHVIGILKIPLCTEALSCDTVAKSAAIGGEGKDRWKTLR